MQIIWRKKSHLNLIWAVYWCELSNQSARHWESQANAFWPLILWLLSFEERTITLQKSKLFSNWCFRIWVNFRMFNNVLYSLHWIFSVLWFWGMSLFIAWTILLNYFLSKFFEVSLHFLCLVFVQDIEELFLIVVLLGTVFGT